METTRRASCNASHRSLTSTQAFSRPVLAQQRKPFQSCRLPPSAAPLNSQAQARTFQSSPVFRPQLACQAAPAAEAAASTSAPTQQQWYALVASAEFFFNDAQNESLAEQLRERVRFFKEQGKERDFHFVPEPKWLDSKYPELSSKVKKPCVALVSTDKNWIVFMKLRLDRVLRIDLGSVPQAEVLAVGGTIPEMKGPEKWTAPYPRYTSGWWNVFVPGSQ